MKSKLTNLFIFSIIANIYSFAQELPITFKYKSHQQFLIYNQKDHLIKSIIIYSETYKDFPDSALFTYDGKGNILSEKFVSRLSLGGGQVDYNKTFYFYSYDSDGDIITNNCQYFDGKDWINDYKISYNYNQSKKLTSEIKEIWFDNKWINHSNIIYTYNDRNLLESDLMLKWKNGAWVYDFKRTYGYDSIDNISGFIRENWLNGNWVNSYKITYEYDSRRNITGSLGENWYDSLWINSFSLLFSYDSLNKIVSREEKRWKKYDLFYNDSTAFIYDTNQNLNFHSIDIKIDSLYHQTGFFVNTYDYNYDSIGKILNKITKKYNSLGLNIQWLDTYLYDEDGFITEGLYETWDGVNWQKTDRLSLTIDIEDSHRKKTFLTSHCYKYNVNYFLSMGVEDAKQMEPPVFSVSPNPVSNELTIRINRPILYPFSFKLYNSNGFEILKFQDDINLNENNDITIHLENISQGFYYLVFNSINNFQVEKIILLK